MNTDICKQRINQYLAEAPGLSPRIVCGEPRQLARKLMFATSDPQGRGYFVGVWAVYDPDKEQVWTTRHGWLEFEDELPAHLKIRRAWLRIIDYRIIGIGGIPLIGR